MKKWKLFIILISLFAFFGCKEEEKEQPTGVETPTTGVEQYINSLKTAQYEDKHLPEFTSENIEELLKYKNEKDNITKFPVNHLSSYHQEGCELGVYVLWTIEYVRIKHIDSSLLFLGRFPSLNPILRLRDSDNMEPVFTSEAYQTAADAYYSWWTNNQDKSIEEIMKIDPLENTKYKWY